MKTLALTVIITASLIVVGCGPSQTDTADPTDQQAPVQPDPVPVAARPFGYHGTLPGVIELDRWQTAESCSECHESIYEEWQGTMHSNAGRDPLFLGAVTTLRNRVDEELERTELRTCIRCHSAAGHLSAGVMDSFADIAPLSELDERGGVFCGFCHVVSESIPRDGGFEVEPGPHSEDLGVMRGTLRDARDDGHQVAYSELHSRAAFCGTCHDMQHAFSGVPIMSTYTEWNDSPYNSGNADTTVVCQDCHMRQQPSVPATASTDRPDRPGRLAPTIGDISPERPNVAGHHFVGGNTLMPGVLVDEEHGPMARERLQAAATLELGVPDRAAPGGPITIEARVTNVGAGHKLPTGMTTIRQMWVELRVVSATAGVTVFESGDLDDDGALDDEAHTFGTTYGNAAGEPVFTFTRAAQVLRDHRIGPRETVTERFEFTAPSGGGGTLEVHAKLRYRPVTPEMIEAVMPGQVDEIEITDMAEAEATITVAN